MDLVLYERVGHDGCRPSPFSWRVRYAVWHKKIDVVYRPTRFSDVDTIERLSGQRLVPVLVHDGTVVCDSWNIALYLEDRFSERPTLFGGRRNLERATQTSRVLSNGSPFMLQHAMESAGINDLIDKCLSIEEVRVYKPDAAAYQIATSALKLQSPSEACFFSSNAWDVAGAHTFGFRAFWVNRSNQPEEYGLHKTVQKLSSLSDAIELVVS